MSQELTTAISVSILTAALGWTSVSVVCEGPRNQCQKYIRLSGVASLQSASLLFVNHLLWDLILFYFI